MTSLLPGLKKPHIEYCLLRSCLSLPKIAYSLRTVDTTDCKDILQEFDLLIQEALIRIIGAPVSARQWLQARLPTGQGGLGLRGAEETAAASYTSSYISAQPYVKRLRGLQHEELPNSLPQSILDSISLHTGEVTTHEELHGLTQKMLGIKIDKHNYTKLKDEVTEEGNTRETARLASFSLPYAGA